MFVGFVSEEVGEEQGAVGRCGCSRFAFCEEQPPEQGRMGPCSVCGALHAPASALSDVRGLRCQCLASAVPGGLSARIGDILDVASSAADRASALRRLRYLVVALSRLPSA
ncbi:hypothetical protein NDU88_003235 [Pleurodeles waltl]|uniref:Uncharacterized protein n=1 Tax=Pleurodeles waltl TaxID=8319 RepID=A0AAV7W1J7_PLEWA|nr:hypothetical protein NDU88_003235 [Pleurodeles waltl]